MGRIIHFDYAPAPTPVARPFRVVSKAGNAPGTQWRQEMQIRWLEAAVAAQERHDEPEMDPESLRLPCPPT